MIFECDAKDITFSEFIEIKVAAAVSTTYAKIKLRIILEFIGKF
jgi:hypothetical protein